MWSLKKIFGWESHFCVQTDRKTDGWTDKYDEANNRSSQIFYEAPN